MDSRRKREVVIEYIVPSVALVVVVSGLLLKPKMLLNDPFLFAAASIIVGIRSAVWVRSIIFRKIVGLFALIGILSAAWTKGFGVMHTPDAFFTKPTAYTILVIGVSIGWLLVATGMHARLRYTAPEVHWTLDARKRRHWPVLVIVVFALFFGCYHLNGLNFQNDEYYHVEAAEGFLHTGKPVLWNFETNTPKLSLETGEPISYYRSFAYTLQVVASVKLFGWSEVSARLPAVLWYVLLSVCVYAAAYLYTRRRGFAFLVAFTLIAFDHVMLYGRIVRMYSMTMVLALGMIGLFYLLYLEWVRPRVSVWKIVMYGLACAVLTALAASVHLITILLVPAFGVFLCVEMLLNIRPTQALYHPLVVRRLQILVLVMGIGLLVALLGLFLSHQAITEYFIGIRKDANLPYFFFPFQDNSIPVLALVLFIASLVYARGSRALRYITVLNLSVVYAFVYIVTRYSAPRYMLFILPLVLLQTMLVLYEMASAYIPLTCRPWIRTSATLVVCALALTPLSVVLPLDLSPIAQIPRFDRTHDAGYGYNVRDSYAFVRAEMKDDDVLMTVDFRSYYWKESTTPVIELPKDKEMTLEVFQELLLAHPHAWVIIPEGKLHHLTASVQQFLVDHAVDRSLPNTQVRIYWLSL